MNTLDQYLIEQSRMSLDLQNAVKDVPTVTGVQFAKQSRPGDIIACAIGDRFRTSGERKFALILNRIVQRGPYTTLKLATEDGKWTSFALQEEEDGTHYHQVDPFIYSRYTKDAVLLRIPNLTDEKRQKMFSYFWGHPEKKYGYDKIFERFIKEILRIPLKKDADEYRAKAIRKTKSNFICSSAVALSMHIAGYKFFEDPYTTWPRDYIINPHLERICKIQR